MDGSAPVTTATSAPALSSGGWTNTPVTVQFKATDNVNGSGVKSVIVAVSGAENRASTTDGDTASVTIATVASSEAESGLWEGDQGPDVLIHGTTVKLRAERAGQTPRVYTITASGTDRAGNVATVSATCTVAKPGP